MIQLNYQIYHNLHEIEMGAIGVIPKTVKEI